MKKIQSIGKRKKDRKKKEKSITQCVYLNFTYVNFIFKSKFRREEEQN